MLVKQQKPFTNGNQLLFDFYQMNKCVQSKLVEDYQVTFLAKTFEEWRTPRNINSQK